MKLAALLNRLATIKTDLDFGGLCLDSRKIRQGDIFVALHGAKQHGLIFADQAVANGAVAVLYDPDGTENLNVPINFGVMNLAISNLSGRLGFIAANFYGHPCSDLQVIGITGTNGKTTCSQLIAQALPDCGVIGTLGWGEPGRLEPTANTTPDALELHRILKQFVEQRKNAVAMEVSSHGLQQGRVNAIEFTGAVFTNLTRDHLDYHQDMEDYLTAKLTLFRDPKLRFVVVNLDDGNSDRVIGAILEGVKVWTFSRQGRFSNGSKHVNAENIRHSAEGIHFEAVWSQQKISAFTPLVGDFNLENILAVLSVLLALDIPFEEAVARLARLTPIAGRMEKFGGGEQPTVFVDYAHSPDALEKALMASKSTGKLWVVFGCGGERDRGKRAEMGRIATTFADHVLVTDDNPRHESPEIIIKDILAGCRKPNVTVIHDRAKAISFAIQEASNRDCIMIAGKGHENYQEINGVRLPFSDRDVVKRTLDTRCGVK